MNRIFVDGEQMMLSHIDAISYLLIGGTFLCLLFLYIFRWRDYILPYFISKKSKKSDGCEIFPKLSIVIPAYDETEFLRHHLFHILNQDYPDFEVIVVNEDECQETNDLLEQVKLRYQHLRTTFIPKSATEICRRKLSITLGIRAARAEWVVISTAGAIPESNQWLKRLARHMVAEADVVLGYANYIDNGSPLAQRAIYERLRVQLRCYRSAMGYGAIGGDEINFAVRKSAFMKQRGYADNLGVNVGESHLLIDNLSRANNVKVALDPEAIVREDLPSREILENSYVAYREILHHSSKKVHFYLRREGLATLMNVLFLLLFIAFVLLRVINYLHMDDFLFTSLFVDLGMLLLYSIYMILPIILFRKTTHLLGERNIGLRLYWWSIQQPFVNLKMKIKRSKIYVHSHKSK